MQVQATDYAAFVHDPDGYRLDPRISTLSLNFVATSGSALDGYRDTPAVDRAT